MTQALVTSVIDNHPLNLGVTGADWITDPGNVSVVRGRDVTLFDDIGEGIYEIHVIYQSSRGREAIERVREALDEIFVVHGANAVYGLVPRGRAEVSLLARWTGFKPSPALYTPWGWCERFIMTRPRWEELRK